MRRVSDTKGVMHGVQSAAEYRARMTAYLAEHGRRPVSAVTTGAAAALEVDGFLRLRCACGNYPIADPVWKLACCFNCGHVFEAVALPGEA